jgi:ATP-dependent RNA helicase DDX54/DBP10
MMPQEKQAIMMSATMPKDVQEFATIGIREYRYLQLDKESHISDKLILHFLISLSLEKYSALIYILTKIVKSNSLNLVFVSTKYHVQYLEALLPLFNIRAVGIYGDLDPTVRKINFSRFSQKQSNVLVVTDVAARGLDIPLLDNVIHFDFPPTPKMFVHRTGRTARYSLK